MNQVSLEKSPILELRQKKIQDQSGPFHSARKKRIGGKNSENNNNKKNKKQKQQDGDMFKGYQEPIWKSSQWTKLEQFKKQK